MCLTACRNLSALQLQSSDMHSGGAGTVALKISLLERSSNAGREDVGVRVTACSQRLGWHKPPSHTASVMQLGCWHRLLMYAARRMRASIHDWSSGRVPSLLAARCQQDGTCAQSTQLHEQVGSSGLTKRAMSHAPHRVLHTLCTTQLDQS